MKAAGRVTGPFRDHRGIGVAEVIIALAIITVGLVGLMAAMPLSTSQIAESSLKTTAAFLAQQRLERIKNAQWTAAVDALGGGGSNGSAAVAFWPDEDYDTISFPGAPNCGATDRSGGCRFRRQVRIRDCNVAQAVSQINPPSNNCPASATIRQVTTTVFFKPMTGPGTLSATESFVQVTTLIARR